MFNMVNLQNLLMTLYSLYNENIIIKNNEKGIDNYNFMMSVVELKSENNTLYVTSEELLTPRQTIL